MSNVVIARVDDRFIHGQISVKWCRSQDINYILVANDSLSKDKVRQGLMDMTVPQNVITRYCSINEVLDIINTLPEDKRVMLICDSIQDIISLYQLGLDFNLLNLGNIAMNHGKIHLTSSVSVSVKEKEQLAKLHSEGVEIEIRKFPSDESLMFSSL